MNLVAAACMLLWCSTFCTGDISSHWINTTDKYSYFNYKTEATGSWWAAAKTMCARTGGHLFVTQKQSGLGDLINLLDENKLYWVDGFQYTILIWTVDNTRYYRRLGYMFDVYGGHVTPSTIEDNSAFMCNMRCGTNHGLFGLKGQSCYCFGDRSEQLIHRLNIANDTTHTEIRCPGDYTELCGDNRRISVYTGVGDMANISRNGTCGYATKYYRNTRKKTFHLDDDCNRKRFYAYKKPTEVTRDGSRLRCRGDVCVSNTTESWAAADQQNHRLLKVTDSNKEHFWSAMHYSTYWIGLSRYSEWRWINGNNKMVISCENGNRLARNVSRYYLDKQCLAVRREDSHFYLGWSRCWENYNAVCQSHNRISTKPHTTKDDTGIYIGVAVSIVAVAMLCLIVAIILLKRKGLCCFKSNDEREGVHFNRSPNQLHGSHITAHRHPGQVNSPNATDQHKHRLDSGPCCDGDELYSEMDSLECHVSSTPYTGTYHHINAAGFEAREYNTTRQAQPVRRDDRTYHHICKEQTFETSDPDGDQYNELKHGRSSGQTSASTGVYHHVGPGGAGEGEDQYNVLKLGRSPGQTNASTGVYHHVGPGVANEGFYQTAKH